MGDWAIGLWTWLTGVPGTLALVFIVAIALGINAMTLVFTGSAVVALERFARASRRWSTRIGCVIAWSLVLGLFSLYLQSPEVANADAGTRFSAFLQGSGQALLGVLAFSLLAAAVLRYLPERALLVGVLVALGLATALVLGGSAQAGYAAAPLVVALLVTLWARWRRRKRGEEAAGDVERMFSVLAASLAVGVPLAWLLPEADPRVAATGASMFGCSPPRP